MYRDCKQVYNVIRTINTKLLLVALFAWHLLREFTADGDTVFKSGAAFFFFEEEKSATSF